MMTRNWSDELNDEKIQTKLSSQGDDGVELTLI